MWSWPTGPACRWRSWPQRPSRGLGGYGASRSCCSRSWARQDFPSEYHTILRDSVTADHSIAPAASVPQLHDAPPVRRRWLVWDVPGTLAWWREYDPDQPAAGGTARGAS